MIKLILTAITAVALMVVYIWKARPSKTDKLQERIDDLDKQIAHKRQAISDALAAGNESRYSIFYAQWLKLCRKRNRLRKRLPED